MNKTSVDTKRLRILIGLAGILLPWLVVLITRSWPESISITYYSLYAVGIFMIILGAASVLLICYKGYDRGDDITATIAGVFGLLICLFPTKYPDAPELTAGIFQWPSTVNVVFHCIGAFGFFGAIAYMSIFRFTKTDGALTTNKKIRNCIYRVCGVGMLASFLLMLLKYTSFAPANLVWIVEMISLTFFGISWLVKSGAVPLLHDKKDNK